MNSYSLIIVGNVQVEERFKYWINMGSGFGGWVKGFLAIGAVIIALTLNYYATEQNTADNTRQDRHLSNHYSLIQSLEKDNVKLQGDIDILKSEMSSARSEARQYANDQSQTNSEQRQINTENLKALQAISESVIRLNTIAEVKDGYRK